MLRLAARVLVGVANHQVGSVELVDVLVPRRNIAIVLNGTLAIRHRVHTGLALLGNTQWSLNLAHIKVQLLLLEC